MNEPAGGRRPQHLQRVPPHDHQTEANLLGAAMLVPAAAEIVTGLDPAIFYKPSHQVIADQISRLRRSGAPTDPGTLTAELRRAGQLDAAGGSAALVTIQSECPATSSAAHWANLLVELAGKRRVLSLASEVVEAVYTGIPLTGLVTEMHQAALSHEAGVASSWEPVNLAAILAGEGIQTVPALVWRADGVPLVYPGKVNTVQAEAEAGKSWFCLAGCAQEIAAGQHALYVDFEGDAADITERMLSLGCQPAEILERFHYIRPDDPIDAAAQLAISHACNTWHPTLTVVDGVTEAMALSGWSIKENDDVARFFAALPRLMARTGAGVILIDHVVKDKERQDRFAIGAQHKLAGSDGATYKLESVTPFSVGHAGISRLIVTKDRHGQVRPHCLGQKVAAMVNYRPDGLSLTVSIDPPDPRNQGVTFRPTVLMSRVSEALAHGPALTLRQLRQAVRGKNDAIDLAVRLLVAEGYIAAHKQGQATYHSHLRPYEEETEQHETF